MIDAILKPPEAPRNPYLDIFALHVGVSRLKVTRTSKNSGNVNSSTLYGSHNDNGTVTRISKGELRVLSILSVTDPETSQMNQNFSFGGFCEQGSVGSRNLVYRGIVVRIDVDMPASAGQNQMSPNLVLTCPSASLLMPLISIVPRKLSLSTCPLTT